MIREYRHYLAKAAMRSGKLPYLGNATLIDGAVVFFDNLGIEALEYIIQNNETLWSRLNPPTRTSMAGARNGSLALKAFLGVDPLDLGELFIEVLAEVRPEMASVVTPEWVATNYIEFMQEPET